ATAQEGDLRFTGRDYQLEEGVEGSGLVDLVMAGTRIALPAGPLPVESVAAAVVLASELMPDMTTESLSQVARSDRVPGRFERLMLRPEVVVDVGHNPHAAPWLAGKLAALAG